MLTDNKITFIIFDKDDGIIERLKKRSLSSDRCYTLLSLNYNAALVNRVESFLKEQGFSVEVIWLQKEIESTAFLLRKEYIHFIYKFGEKKVSFKESIRSYFNFPLSNFSLWWPSLVAEKNTVKSMAFYNLVKFYTLLKLIEQKKPEIVFLQLGNRAIFNSLLEWGKENSATFENLGTRLGKISKNPIIFYSRGIRSLFFYIGRIIKIRLQMHQSYKLRKQSLKGIKYLLITYFPLIDTKAIKERRFIDKMFQPIQNALKKEGKQYAWFANIINFGGYGMKEIIKLGKNINDWNEILIFWEEATKLRDLILLILNFHWIVFKYALVRNRIKKALIFEKDNLKINIWHIFKNECDESFCGSVLIYNLFCYLIFKRIFKYINKDTIILYPAEMQGWEKMLCAAAIETGRSKTIAIQHAAVPMLLLNYFFDENEIRNRFAEGSMPKPYKLACVGEIPKRLLMESGWSKENVFILGGIRFNHYLDLLKKNIDWSRKQNKIIVALSINPEESKELISMCLEAFGKEEGISVIFKAHPWSSVMSLLGALKINSLAPPFYISDSPLSELLRDSKIIVVTESSATFEGLACGCQVVIPRLNNALQLNPLTGLSDLPVYINSAIELREFSRNIMLKEDVPYPRKKAFDFINQYITFRKDEEFLESIEAQFV